MALTDDQGELVATIIREGIGKGLLNGARPLQVTDTFQKHFAGVIDQLDAPAVREYVEQILRVYPETKEDHRTFMGVFVSKYEEVPVGAAAIELLMDGAGEALDNFLLSLRAFLGLVAVVIHRRRFPVSVASAPS